MTYLDYETWANDYRSEVDVIDKAINRRRKLRFFDSAEAREDNENAIQMLYEMRRDCVITAALLKERAKMIKEKEENEQYSDDKRENRRALRNAVA